MLTPEYYETLTDDLIALYADLDEAIIKDITRRILKTGRMTESAKWQAKQLQESGFLYDDILAEIAKRTDATQNHVRALFEDAGVKSVEIDNTFYHAAEISGIVKLSDAALQTMNAGYLKCSGNLKNLTLTTANTSQQAYINACNSAYMQVTSGAFDYGTAIKNAIKKCAEDGAYVLYPTGHRERIDVAVRRAVLTGVGQTCRELSKVNAEDMDCDIMEITAHAGARPSHAEWQGQLVSLLGKNAGKIIEGRRVLSLSDIGYDTGDGFGGWNCRHDWYSFFVGISKRAYSDERLKQLEERNIEYNGKMYNQYEISQIQRKFEREIRAAKREKVAFEVAVKEATDGELQQVMQDSLNYSKSVLSEKQAKMRDFIQQTGQLRDYSKEQNYGRVTYKKDFDYGLTSEKNSDIIIKKAETDSKLSFNLIKGEHTLEQDLKATNPNYKTGDEHYTRNCQRCVCTYEMRRRGYDVIAKPCLLSDSDELPIMNNPNGWANVFKNHELKNITANSGKGIRTKVIEQMKEWGNGSRAIIRVGWNDSGYHTFFAEQVGENTMFIDPQSGKLDVKNYFLLINKEKTYIMRVDNLEITERILECCE